MNETQSKELREHLKNSSKDDLRTYCGGLIASVYASAHDFRRAFGHRWARRVMPMVLKDLMRHASVTTTEKYYVNIQAEEPAKFLRQVTLEVTPTKKEAQQNAETP